MPSDSPHAHELRSLALIRRLLTKAEDEADAPSPVAALSLTSQHTAAEWFLQLAAERHDVDAGSFLEHWNEFDQQAGIQLGHKASMKRLDNLRGDLKHYGSIPSESDIRSLLTRTREFLEANTPKTFSVEFSEISLARAVPIENARKSLLAAESALANDNPRTAVEEAAIAMEKTLRSVSAHDVGVADFHRFGRFDVSDVVGETGSRRFAKFARKLRGELDSIYRVLQLLTLGVDLQRYEWFSQITPEVTKPQVGDYTVSWIRTRQDKPTLKEGRDCIEFVAETALAAYEMAPPTT